MDEKTFTHSLFEYRRQTTSQVKVGTTTIGGDAPIRVQSMTTTDTNDVEASVEQSVRIIEAGGELVRLTTQGEREAKSIGLVKEGLVERGFQTPVVADIHFNARAAEVAASRVDAVRINPGNFTGEAKRFKADGGKYTDEEWQEVICAKLKPLVGICQEHHTAMRLGINHGSLSDRIMDKYGDTPEGMVASCTEYLDALESLGFTDIVISIKSSNTRVMVETVRLLAATMRQRQRVYPLHLGVTEAGSDAEGRIKSAAGIGALLADGLGDTIRVSLTEAPEAEIPVARALVGHIMQNVRDTQNVKPVSTEFYSPYTYRRRTSTEAFGIGGVNSPIVGVSGNKEAGADWFYDEASRTITDKEGSKISIKGYAEEWGTEPIALELQIGELMADAADKLKSLPAGSVIIGLRSTPYSKSNYMAEMRAMSLELLNRGIDAPFVACYQTETSFTAEEFPIEFAASAGPLFIDGLADGIIIRCADTSEAELCVMTADLLLQATRARFSRTEFISCPGCGRTLYDIQQTVRQIKERMGHLKGLKIGVMGCIVNGIGEMADADYGYVGAGRKTISLYRGKELVSRALPEEEALDALTELIKADGKWVETPQK